MEPKKNPACDVERHRGLLFSAGLITSLVIVIVAFESFFEVTKSKPPKHESPDETILPFVLPTDHMYKKVTPKPVKKIFSLATVKEAKHTTEKSHEPLEESLPPSEEPIFTLTDISMPPEIISCPFIPGEKMPEPIGGMQGFYSFLKKNLRYPKTAERIGRQGKVFVEFIVNEHGLPSDFKILKGIGAGCDEEAIRVLSLSRWMPGEQRGVPVKVRMVQAVSFQLSQ